MSDDVASSLIFGDGHIKEMQGVQATPSVEACSLQQLFSCLRKITTCASDLKLVYYLSGGNHAETDLVGERPRPGFHGRRHRHERHHALRPGHRAGPLDQAGRGDRRSAGHPDGVRCSVRGRQEQHDRRHGARSDGPGQRSGDPGRRGRCVAQGLPEPDPGRGRSAQRRSARCLRKLARRLELITDASWHARLMFATTRPPRRREARLFRLSKSLTSSTTT